MKKKHDKYVKMFCGWAIIAGGCILSTLISYGIILAELLVFNPRNRTALMTVILLIPLACYGIGYSLWYCRHAKEGTRNEGTYNDIILFVILGVMVDVALTIFIVNLSDFMDEAVLHIMLSFFMTATADFIAMVSCRPH